MLIGSNVAGSINNLLEPIDFYKESHREIFAAMRHLLGMGTPVDLVTVVEALKERKTLGDIGGQAYLAKLMKSVAVADHAEHYARIVKAASYDRQTMAQLAKTAAEKTPENIAILGDLIGAAEGLYAPQHFDFRKDLAVQIDEILKKREPGMPIGFEAFDRATGGIDAGELVIIGGRPSDGKTAFSLAAAMRMAERYRDQGKGDTILYLTTEMTAQSLLMRAVAAAAKVEIKKFRTKKFETADYDRITRACAEYLSTLPLLIAAREMPTMADIRAAVRSTGARVLFIDLLQRCRLPPAQNRTYQIQEFLGRLNGFLLTTGVRCFLLCQLDRGRDRRSKEPPQLSDLKDSGAIEAEADIAILLWRPPPGTFNAPAEPGCEVIEGRVAKGRNVGRPTFHISLNGEFVRVAETAEGDLGYDGEMSWTPDKNTASSPEPETDWLTEEIGASA